MGFDTQRLAGFIADRFAVDQSELKADTPLFSSGLLDSFSLVELLSHIEETAGIKVGVADVSLENLDSIARIEAFVGRCLGRSG